MIRTFLRQGAAPLLNPRPQPQTARPTMQRCYDAMNARLALYQLNSQIRYYLINTDTEVCFMVSIRPRAVKPHSHIAHRDLWDFERLSVALLIIHLVLVDKYCIFLLSMKTWARYILNF
ncbi:hypothetical protein K505DRAFT_81269 [Melanomma pulvis-pyrius CBS 109.77]|uniref:Uncharacterized protein n=1 Tax=Melanomma pulvis-pyrius CBS 109.77 TaxID=1314802 RepID=A0A6A6X1Y9_9PLEO|nr:hypothetical protein K505DRAFT_81269 [Melanomma pulvis-pyrius CBS 109.77]